MAVDFWLTIVNLLLIMSNFILVFLKVEAAITLNYNDYEGGVKSSCDGPIL